MPDSYKLKYNIPGHIPVWITPEATQLPYIYFNIPRTFG